jgi:hypothetical protein
MKFWNGKPERFALAFRSTSVCIFAELKSRVPAAWSLAASATMQATEATTATLPQIEMARVKPVDRLPPDLRLSDLRDRVLEPPDGYNVSRKA